MVHATVPSLSGQRDMNSFPGASVMSCGIQSWLWRYLQSTSEWVEINAVPLEAFFIKPAYRPVDGYVTAPDKPGLGFEIDWDTVEKYAVKEATGSLYY